MRFFTWKHDREKTSKIYKKIKVVWKIDREKISKKRRRVVWKYNRKKLCEKGVLIRTMFHDEWLTDIEIERESVHVDECVFVHAYMCGCVCG